MQQEPYPYPLGPFGPPLPPPPPPLGLKHPFQGRRKRGAGGPVFGQTGGQIIPTTVLQASPDFQTLRRACF